MKNTNLHYEFTEEKIEFLGRTLHRIKAIKDLPFYRVEIGDLGGFIEKYENLQDNAWVGDKAMVFGDALISENAIVYENAIVCENAKIFGNAKVSGNAKVYGEAVIYEYSDIYSNALVFGKSNISGMAKVCGDSKVYENSKVYDNVEVRGHSKVFGNAVLYGDAVICGYSEIQSKNDICTFSYFSKNNNTITFFNTKDNIIGVNYGFFYGTVEEFIEEIKENYDDKFIKECLAIIEVVKIKFNINIP